MGPEFNRSLQKVAKPELETLGFEFDGKRRFTRINNNSEEQVIEYQVGTRALQGRFTVNLISGKRFERLAMIRPTILSRIANRVFGDYNPWWKGLFMPKDDWWIISPFQKEMDSIIENTVSDLKSFGIIWFNDE